MITRKAMLGVEALEARDVPAGFMSAAVQADFAQISTDTKTFSSNLAVMLPTIQKDQQAIGAAIKNAIANDPSVQAAQATLNTDLANALAEIQIDVKAYKAATTDTARAAIVQQFQTDLSTGGALVGADAAAVQTAIHANAGVQAAQAQFNADAAPLFAELAAIQADYTQLHKDIGV